MAAFRGRFFPIPTSFLITSLPRVLIAVNGFVPLLMSFTVPTAPESSSFPSGDARKAGTIRMAALNKPGILPPR